MEQTQDAMVPKAYRVQNLIEESHDTFSMVLVPKAQGVVESFKPGQFNMLYAFGVGEVPISISGAGSDKMGLVHTIREVGFVTRALHQLKKDSTVGLRGPFGRAWPIETAKGSDIIIMAGGIGLAPLRPAIYALMEQRDQFGEIAVLYGARTPKDLLFANEFKDWRGKYGIQVKITVDTADRDWKGNVGVVTSCLPRVSFDPDHAMAMICGPEIMMRYSILELKQLGVAENQIYLTMERNMKCAIGFCGHCQFGPSFICKDGPVFSYPEIRRFFTVREI
ncbi:MAG: FAD/NAD(P)-binding protein [Nitrospinota bacterium]